MRLLVAGLGAFLPQEEVAPRLRGRHLLTALIAVREVVFHIRLVIRAELLRLQTIDLEHVWRGMVTRPTRLAHPSH
jgi:hypothetical protein